MDQITDLLRELAAQLGVGAEYLWPLLVKQTVVRWWSLLGVAVFLWILSLFPLKVGLNESKKKYEDKSDDFMTAMYMVFAVVVVIAIAVSIVTIGTLDRLIVPEAATIERLLSMV